MPVETVIRGGQIATAEATYRAEIGIEDGRISVIADRVEGDNVIDASGCIVVPGGIDVHTHFDTQIGDMRTADDYESGSRAAAFGGVTTFVNYAFQGDGESLADALAREAGKAAATELRRLLVPPGHHARRRGRAGRVRGGPRRRLHERQGLHGRPRFRGRRSRRARDPPARLGDRHARQRARGGRRADRPPHGHAARGG